MAQPGMFKPPNDEGWIGRKLQDLEQQLNQLRAANPFATMGMKPMPDGVEFNGNLKVGGTLDLPGGIIGNDALANPIITETSSNYLNNYAVDTISTVRVSLTFVVPDGFTQAVVMANPTGMAQNTTATTDYLYVQAVVNGVNGGEMYTAAGPGLAVGIASPFHTTIYGLTGGQEIPIAVATRTGFGTWPASTANQANIYATVLFFR
jgi:hypothetical protein